MPNGREYFKASIDTAQFDRDAKHIKSTFNDIGKTAEMEGARMENSLRKVGTAVAGIFSIRQASQFIKSIVDVRSEFQNTEAMFKVFLGSAEKASSFMKEISEYSLINVFDFPDLTQNAAQLLAYGASIEDVIPTLDKLSTVATGVNQPLDRFVHLYNRAKSLGKLTAIDIQQWSVLGDVVAYLADMLDKSTDEIRTMISTGQIGFKELDDLINQLTASGGKFHGMMEEKIKTLGDTVGALRDAITLMFNEIGEKNQDVLRSGILLANDLVENYEKIGKVIAHLIGTYGAYKASVIALNTVQSLQTKIALESALAGTKLTTVQGLQAVATKSLTAVQASLNKTMLANPYVLASTALLGLSYATYKAVSYKTELQKASEEATKSVLKERVALDNLVTRLNATKKDTSDYNSIKKEINGTYREALTAINLEVDALYQNTANYKLLTKEIENNTKAKLKNKYIEEFSDKSADDVAKNYKKILDRVKKQVGGVEAGTVFGDIREFISDADVNTSGKAFEELFKKHGLRWNDYAKDINSLLSSQYRLKSDLEELDSIFGDTLLSTEGEGEGVVTVMKSLVECLVLK